MARGTRVLDGAKIGGLARSVPLMWSLALHTFPLPLSLSFSLSLSLAYPFPSEGWGLLARALVDGSAATRLSGR